MAPDQTAPIPAGWYPDPYGAAEMRWWDGLNWTDSIHPPATPAQSAAPPAHVPEPVAPQVEPVVPEGTQAEPVSKPEHESNPFGALGFSVPISEPVSAIPTTESTPAALPSRRELRKRAEQEAEGSPSAESWAVEDSSPIPTYELTTPPPAASTPAPSQANETVPDSSAPTAFDWLSDPNAGGLDLPPFGAPADPSPVRAASASEFADFSGLDTNVWTQDAAVENAEEGTPRPTATRMATTSSWFIAIMPLLAGVLSASAVKAQENYPRYVPVGVEWWMLVAGVIAVLYLVTLLLAAADRRKLDWAGYNQPAHWAWAFLSAPVYLLVRTISVKRETGRNSLMLWIWLLMAGVLVGAWFAANAFAPELLSGYTLPFL